MVFAYASRCKVTYTHPRSQQQIYLNEKERGKSETRNISSNLALTIGTSTVTILFSIKGKRLGDLGSVMFDYLIASIPVSN